METKVQRDYVICSRLSDQDAPSAGIWNQSNLAQEPRLLTTLLACIFMEKVNMQIQGGDAQCLWPGGSSFPECLVPTDQGV